MESIMLNLTAIKKPKLQILLLLAALLLILFVVFFALRNNRSTTEPAGTKTTANKATDKKDTSAKPENKDVKKESTIKSADLNLTVKNKNPSAGAPLVNPSQVQAVTDSDGNQLKAVRLYMPVSSFASPECPVVKIDGVDSIDIATQLIRSERNKPFDVSRYKGEFKKDIFTTANYSYHLNYTEVPCLGESDQATVQSYRDNLVISGD